VFLTHSLGICNTVVSSPGQQLVFLFERVSIPTIERCGKCLRHAFCKQWRMCPNPKRTAMMTFTHSIEREAKTNDAYLILDVPPQHPIPFSRGFAVRLKSPDWFERCNQQCGGEGETRTKNMQREKYTGNTPQRMFSFQFFIYPQRCFTVTQTSLTKTENRLSKQHYHSILIFVLDQRRKRKKRQHGQ
jgi:hypothetical protein